MHPRMLYNDGKGEINQDDIGLQVRLLNFVKWGERTIAMWGCEDAISE